MERPDLNAPLQVHSLVQNVNNKHGNNYYDNKQRLYLSSIYCVSDTAESPLHPFLILIPQQLYWVGIVLLILQMRRSEAQRREFTFPRSHSS